MIRLKFVIDDDLMAYMEKKHKMNIAVEVASSDSSDFNVEELHVRLVPDSQADRMIRQHYHVQTTAEGCRILLPNYRLVYADTVTFHLKKWLCFSLLSSTGIDF